MDIKVGDILEHKLHPKYRFVVTEVFEICKIARLQYIETPSDVIFPMIGLMTEDSFVAISRDLNKVYTVEGFEV